MKRHHTAIDTSRKKGINTLSQGLGVKNQGAWRGHFWRCSVPTSEYTKFIGKGIQTKSVAVAFQPSPPAHTEELGLFLHKPLWHSHETVYCLLSLRARVVLRMLFAHPEFLFGQELSTSSPIGGFSGYRKCTNWLCLGTVQFRKYMRTTRLSDWPLFSTHTLSWIRPLSLVAVSCSATFFSPGRAECHMLQRLQHP
jgi:hypothetical protein